MVTREIWDKSEFVLETGTAFWGIIWEAQKLKWHQIIDAPVRVKQRRTNEKKRQLFVWFKK